MSTLLISQVHGNWQEEYGYVAIPDGTTVYLFQEPGSSMLLEQADWGAIASAKELKDLDGIKEVFEAAARASIEDFVDAEVTIAWLEHIVNNEPRRFGGVRSQHFTRLKKALENIKSLAVLPLVGGDVIYDYRVSSLTDIDQVLFADTPGDPAVKRVRSEIVGKLNDEDIMLGKDSEQFLSDYLRDYRGWEIYWFACQDGAAVKPNEEFEAMRDRERIQIIS